MTVETISYLGIHIIRKNLSKEKYSGVITYARLSYTN